jgi:hypothetical protein
LGTGSELPGEDERPVMQDLSRQGPQIWTNCPATRPGNSVLPQ